MKVSMVLPIFACAAALTGAAQSVTSAFVPVRAPGKVFDPMPESSGGNDTARLFDTTNVFTAAYVKDFAVDGDMAKAVWRNAAPVSPLQPMKGKAFRCATELKLLYSSSALYVGATFMQPMDKIRAQYDQDDQPIHNDDNVEILFLVPSGTGEDMLHLAINALGSCWDAKNGRSVWNLKKREIKTRRLGDRWTFEAKFPFAGLGIERPVPGDFIGVRFCRFTSRPWERASAPQLLESGNNQRRRFAKLVFAEPDGKAARAAAAYRARVTKERAAQRLAAAKRRIAVQEAVAVQFPDQTHPVFSEAVQALHQMKKGLADFECGKLSTNDFIALDAGFRRYVGEHAYAAWRASPWEKGSPERLPPQNAAVGGRGVAAPPMMNISFEQAGNEREAVCLEFTGVMCGPRLDLRLLPQSIDEPEKARFVSCDAFEIYEEPFVNYEKELITAPLVQKPGNMITLTPGRVTRVWIVFNSRGVNPGEYATRILLKPAYDVEAAEQALEVNMKVWNFALPETRDWPLQTFFWGPNYYACDEAQVLRLMHDNHVTHGWTKSQLYTFGINRDCRVVRRAKKADPEFFDRHLAETANEAFFRTAKDLGMRFVFGWGCPDRTPEWFRIMDRRLSAMGFDRRDYIFKTLIRDEFVKKDIPTLADRRAAVTREFGTNLWFQAVYLSTPPPTGATIEDIEEAHLPEFYKMWTVIDGVFRDPVRGPDVTRRLRAKGCKVWTYTCARYMQTQDVLNYYRFFLWRAYMRGLDGAAMWTSGRRLGDDGWDSRDGYDDGILWAGVGKQMIPTKRFEAFREGLEDVAYMDLLEKIVNGRDVRCPSEGAGKRRDGRCPSGASLPAAIAEAKALLDAREDVIKAHDQKKLDAWRLAVGRAIDAVVVATQD